MRTIRLLGAASIEGPEGPLTGREVQRARIALLALLALSPRRSIGRDRLIALLWPESAPDRARHLLRDSLYRLREALGAPALPGVGDDLRLDPAHVRCDVWDFEEAAARDDVEAADRLYTGRLLDGFFYLSAELEQWVDQERRRLSELHRRMLEALARRYEGADDWPAAVGAWRRLALDDPLSGRFALGLMRALEAAGERGEAIRIAAAHAETLRREVDAMPDGEVEAYAHALRNAATPPARRSGDAARTPSAMSPRAHEPAAAPEIERSALGASATPSRSRVTRTMTVVTTVGVLATVALVAWAASTPDPTLGRATVITTDPGLEIHPAISPDGRFLAYAAGDPGRTRIFVRPIAGGRAMAIADDTTLAVQMRPLWSPDGSMILFTVAEGGAYVVPFLGGTPRPVLPSTPGVQSAFWAPDGTGVGYVRRDSLFVQPLEGTGARFIATGGRYLHACDWSPRLSLIACATGNWEHATPTRTFGNRGPGTIVVIPATGGLPRAITDSLTWNASPAWSPRDGTLYFVSNRDGHRDVHAVRISRSGEPEGEPVRLTTGLGVQSVAVAPDGHRLVYSIYTATANIHSVPIRSAPPISAADAVPLTRGTQIIEAMRVSRDAKWLYYDSSLRGNSDIWRVPLAGGEPEQLTSDPADDFAPEPSPDGRHVAFYSLRAGTRDIYVLPVDGGPMQQITRTVDHEFYPVWSPDGAMLAWSTAAPTFSTYVSRRTADTSWGAPALVASNIMNPRFSPDGRSLLVSRRGVPGLHVYSLDSGTVRTLLSGSAPGDGGPPINPLWVSDGALIWFRRIDGQRRWGLWSMPASGGEPRLLVRLDDPRLRSSRRSWTTDGRRFFFLVDDHQSDVWVSELVTRR